MFPMMFTFELLVILFLFFLVARFATRLIGGRREDSRPGGFGEGRASTLEVRIFRLAWKLRGRITVSDVVLETGLGPAEAEAAMNRLVDGMRVRMEVQEKGMVLYEFPEIIRRLEES